MAFKAAQTLAGHTDAVSAMCWTPSGKFLVTGSFDCTLRVWDGRTLEFLHSLEHGNWVTSLATDSDEHVWVGGGDGSIRLLNPSTGALEKMMAHDQEVWSVALSPDGKLLASGSHDRTIKLLG
jgi:WD40 repeat protein